jgi:hypothetical protein
MSLHQHAHDISPALPSHDDRQSQLKQIFVDRTKSAYTVVRHDEPGLINIVASYDDKKPSTDPLARQNTLAKTIEVLAAQLGYLPRSVRDNFHIVLADNGMTAEQLTSARGVIESVNATLRQSGTGQVKFRVAHAPKDPAKPSTATAAYARNQAFSVVRALRELDHHFGAPVLVTDDDSITTGVADMLADLTGRNKRIGAVAPLNRRTENVVAHATTILPSLWAGETLYPTAQPYRAFPGIIGAAGVIDFCLLTAFGGTRVPKTCSLMLDGNAVQSMQSDAGEIFLVCPEGSFEDMLLSGGLERQGYKVVECQQAEVFDQVRVDPHARCLQQFRWDFDHATAFHDLLLLGNTSNEELVFNGISVLQPGRDGWQLTNISALEQAKMRPLQADAVRAAIVHPTEVRELLSRIDIELSTDLDRFMTNHPYAFSGRMGSFRTVEALQRTVKLCRELVDKITPRIPLAGYEKVEIPVIAVDALPPADQLRFSLECRTARLLGNLAAIALMTSNDIEAGTLRVALLGPRQPTL